MPPSIRRVRTARARERDIRLAWLDVCALPPEYASSWRRRVLSPLSAVAILSSWVPAAFSTMAAPALNNNWNCCPAESLPRWLAGVVRAVVWVGALGAGRAAVIKGGAGGGVIAAPGRCAAGGATGRRGATTGCDMFRGFAMIFGAACRVAYSAIGLRGPLTFIFFAGAMRRAVERFLLEGGLSLNPPSRDVAVVKRLTRRCIMPVRWALDISGVRTPGRSSCGTFCGVPIESRTLRSTETDSALRCACVDVGKINEAVRRADAVVAKLRVGTAEKCRANLGAIVFNPNNERVSEPD